MALERKSSAYEELKNETIKMMIEAGVAKIGNPNDKLGEGLYTLKSGRRSELYINVKEGGIGRPEIMLNIGKLIAANLPDISHLVSSGLGGHALSASVALAALHDWKDVLCCYDRGEAKSHGTGKVLEGIIPNEDSVIVIPDDVFTTGTSVKSTIKSLFDSGIRKLPQAIIVVCDRSDDKKGYLEVEVDGVIHQIPVISIYTEKDFIA
jgi:orotate phosphoribosyltransferase